MGYVQKAPKKLLGKKKRTHLFGDYASVGVGFATLGGEAGESVGI